MVIKPDKPQLERVAIVHPGTRRYPLTERVEVVPLAALADEEGLFPGV